MHFLIRRQLLRSHLNSPRSAVQYHHQGKVVLLPQKRLAVSLQGDVDEFLHHRANPQIQNEQDVSEIR